MKLVLKHIVAFAITGLFVSVSFSQNLAYTIKSGPAIDQVQIFLKPDASYGPTIMQQLTLVIGWETSCATVSPFVTWDDGPALTNPFANTTYSKLDKAGTGTIDGTSYSFAEHTWSRTAGDFATWQAGTEYLLTTVTFSGGKPWCPISLLDFIDAGSTGSANVYVLDHLGNYFTPQYLNGDFYSVPGISSSSNGANGVVATTTVPISLPVTLKNFEGQVSDDCSVSLSWQTGSEQNSLRFTVQRSSDGSNWQSIGSVAAAGNSSSDRDYGYTDRNAGIDKVYYRLLQEDVDGKETYSNVISVRVECGGGVIRVWPTVTGGEVNILLPQGYEKARITVFNLAGQIVSAPEQGSGLNRKLRLDHLPSGIFILNMINSDGSSKSEKIIKK